MVVFNLRAYFITNLWFGILEAFSHLVRTSILMILGRMTYQIQIVPFIQLALACSCINFTRQGRFGYNALPTSREACSWPEIIQKPPSPSLTNPAILSKSQA
jgi:hypothetical protein